MQSQCPGASHKSMISHPAQLLRNDPDRRDSHVPSTFVILFPSPINRNLRPVSPSRLTGRRSRCRSRPTPQSIRTSTIPQIGLVRRSRCGRGQIRPLTLWKCSPERPGTLSNPAFLQGSTVQRKGSQTFNALDGIEVPVARDDSRRTVTTHHRHVQHITGFHPLRRVRLEE